MVSDSTDNTEQENIILKDTDKTQVIPVIDSSVDQTTDPSTDTITTSDSDFIIDDNDIKETSSEEFEDIDEDIELDENDIISIEETDDNGSKNDKLLLVLKRLNQIPNRFNKSTKSIINKKVYKFTNKYNKKDIAYFNSLSDGEKKKLKKRKQS